MDTNNNCLLLFHLESLKVKYHTLNRLRVFNNVGPSVKGIAHYFRKTQM